MLLRPVQAIEEVHEDVVKARALQELLFLSTLLQHLTHYINYDLEKKIQYIPSREKKIINNVAN